MPDSSPFTTELPKNGLIKRHQWLEEWRIATEFFPTVSLFFCHHYTISTFLTFISTAYSSVVSRLCLGRSTKEKLVMYSSVFWSALTVKSTYLVTYLGVVSADTCDRQSNVPRSWERKTEEYKGEPLRVSETMEGRWALRMDSAGSR